MKRLPDVEYELMNAIWSLPEPVTTGQLMKAIGNQKQWKLPALITMLNRLNEKGFIYSERGTKIRYYYTLVKKQDYLDFVTKEFMKTYFDDSFAQFFTTYFDVRMWTDETLGAFVEWVKERRTEFKRYYSK